MINTWSKFNFGTSINQTNYLGDFKEGSSTFLATLAAQSQTLGELLVNVQAAFNLAGGQAYTVSINRSTGFVTISAPGNFSLLLSTGVNKVKSFWSILGFTQAADLTSANTYTGLVPAAQVYYPQFYLQSYVGPNDSQLGYDSTVNRTATGRTEIVRFGIDQMIEMDIQFITNIAMDNAVIKNNPSGVTQAETFMQELISKARFEFVPDISNPGTFFKVVCDQTQGYSDGSGYKLKERFADGLPGIFDTGVITLRVVT